MLKLILRKLGILTTSTGKRRKPTTLPYIFLRAESLVVLLLALYGYFVVREASVWLFLILLLAPDLSLFAYAGGEFTGGLVYDLFHTYTTPLALLVIGVFNSYILLIDISLIWLVHIAQDRIRGLGMKYTETFEGSHLHEV